MATTSETGLVKALGLVDATTLVMGSMIGSGVFIVAADISRQVQSPALLMLTWLVTAALTLVAALSYGELAAAMPHAGGQYVYLRESFGEHVAFLNGWAQFLVIQPAAIAGVAAAFAIYAGYFLHWSPVELRLLAAGEVIFLTVFNYFGVKAGGVVNDIFTVIKVAAVLLLIGAGLFIHVPEVTGNFSHFFGSSGKS